MKLLTVLGTRPEIIRLSLLIERLDEVSDHVLVFTGQNSDPSLSSLFFEELDVRAPDVSLAMTGSGVGNRVGQILAGVERVIDEQRPDRLVILGDTDSALCALVAKRKGVPVLHLEAGNRCFDDRVPEEVNRRVIDHCSDLLMSYTARSREHLLAEGIAPQRAVVIGNPIHEVLLRHEERRRASTIVADLGLDHGAYVLVTAHRQENVDVPERLALIGESLAGLGRELDLPVVVSVHPRTRDRLERLGMTWDDNRVRTCPPLGFHDFVALEASAALLVTDSGTVQEEGCILGVPAVTIRESTERPETVECGSNVVAGVEPTTVLAAARLQITRPRDWRVPHEYLAPSVSAVAASYAIGAPMW